MDYHHIHPDFLHVMNMPDKERIRFLDQSRWLGYPTATLILDTLRGLIEKPAKPRMINLLLVGEPNNGKTTIIRRFHDTHGEAYVNDDGDVVKPVILAEAPPTADEKGFYISILERFYAPYRASNPTAKLRYQAIHLLRMCKTKILVIDEFHHLLTGSAIKQREVMNAIKLFCNELMIPVVGVGTRDAVRVLHSDPQHASRFDVITLPLWQLNHDFQRLLSGFEKILPLKLPSNLHEPETASVLHSISSGNLGDLQRLLNECAKQAITEGEEQITKQIIERNAWVRPTRGIREVIG